jgi:hypothetical protein
MNKIRKKIVRRKQLIAALIRIAADKRVATR